MSFSFKKVFTWKTITVAICSVVGFFLVFLYFFIAPCFNEPLINEKLFYPQKLEAYAPGMMSISGVPAREIFFLSSGHKLNGLFYRVPDCKEVVLINHGNAGNITHRIGKIKIMLDSGLSVFAYDYRGYGKSFGSPSLKGIVEDALAAHDYLTTQEKFKPESIILYGESIGTGVTSELAQQRPCKAIVLESGFTSPEALAKEKLSFLHIYPSILFFHPALDNLSYVRGKHPPLLLFAGKKDTTIPCTHSEKMFQQATEPKLVVYGPNSTHNDFTLDMDLYRKQLSDFLKQQKSQN